VSNSYSYERYTQGNPDYREPASPVLKVPGRKRVVWDSEIGRHVVVK
jgi:hypothetical protein